MSINVSNRLLDVAESLTLNVSLDKLTPAIKKKVIRFLESGYVEGRGVAGQLALQLLREHKCPHIFQETYGLHWFGLPESRIEPMEQLSAVIKMGGIDADYIRYMHIDRLLKAEPMGYIGMYYFNMNIKEVRIDKETVTDTFKRIVLPPTPEIQRVIDLLKTSSTGILSVKLD